MSALRRKPKLEARLLTEWEKLRARIDGMSPRVAKSKTHRKVLERSNRVSALLNKLERRHP